MADLLVEPQALASVAADIEQLGSTITGANAAAESPISGLAPAAADEVSEAIAKLFGAYGRQYQAVARLAAAFHDEFTAALASAGSSYAAAEAGAQALLGDSPLTGNIVAVVMGGSGNPIPDSSYVTGVLNWAKLHYTWNGVDTIFTPENLYPLTGTKSLPLNISVNEGVQILDATIKQQIGAGNSVLVQGYSQSTIIASLEMQNLMNPQLTPNPPAPNQLAFNLLADLMAPNGGLLARFPGLTLPSLGIDFYGATPADTPYTTNIYTIEYDGFADFPQYPLNIFADLNAVAGIVLVHPLYPHLDPSALPPGYSLEQLPTSPDYTGNTNYYMVLNPNLPLIQPLSKIPVIGQPLVDLLQPDLRVLVNLGYGDPNYGYSTGPANLTTPFGLFPHVSPGVIAADLATGAQQGVTAASHDIAAEISGMSVPSIPHSLPTIAPPSTDGFINHLETVTTNVTNAFSQALSTGYGVLLPTADIVNAALISVPAYDVNLFLGGIAQALAGDPMGLVNAIGYPIAATTGLLIVAGGVEGLVVLGAVASIIKDFTDLIP
ncbi:PE family protein [Mycobacterium conspicuum]|uniref:PE family protein n=1 Tax=Mycobacterium conspicuum TaxID=44010 RepID=A0A1X1TIJ1_9MYCO|nr:PE-PPE domain-containing protein [Mycobacterium conspicuum]ORV44316.1 PE family protein [Mycobacterium conspicuum]BBZ42619.1 PE family protein [Mycobacterium conspicuum]